MMRTCSVDIGLLLGDPDWLIMHYGNDKNMQNNLTSKEPAHINMRKENLLKVDVFLSLLSPCF